MSSGRTYFDFLAAQIEVVLLCSNSKIANSEAGLKKFGCAEIGREG